MLFHEDFSKFEGFFLPPLPHPLGHTTSLMATSPPPYIPQKYINNIHTDKRTYTLAAYLRLKIMHCRVYFLIAWSWSKQPNNLTFKKCANI